MSATELGYRVTYVVKDNERLPGDMTWEDVGEELAGVLDGALREWYERRGKDFLVCEPV